MRRLLPPVLLLAALLLGTVLLQGVLTAAPAAAHAMVEATTPADGARLQSPPDRVTIRFNEDVTLGAGYARVLAPGGKRVDTGSAEVTDTTLSVPLRAGLADASYVVTYRVVSADSHPVSGAFTFVVGNGELVPATAAETSSPADPLVAAALPGARWLGYGGLALGLGVPLFVLLCWPAGWAVPLVRRLTGAGLVAVAVGAVASVLLQGPYAAGAGLGSLADPQLLSTTTGSAYGVTVLLRLPLVLLAALLLVPRWRSGRAPGAAWTAGLAGTALALVLTVAGVGHPVAGRLPVLEVAVAAVHVAAMTLWLGGLATLFTAVLRAGTSATELLAALPRWSRLAFGAVTALTATGVVQSLREVGSPAALVQTTYGWVLLAKVAVVLLVIGVAALSRDWVQQQLGRRAPRRPSRRVVAHAFAASSAPVPEPAPEPVPEREPADEPAGQAPPLGLLRRFVLLEVAGAAVVLALSAVLVGLPPAQASVAQPVEVTVPLRSATSASGHGSVQLVLDPAGVGANSGHVYLFDAAGELTQPQQITVTLTEPSQQIGPLPVQLSAAGPGHYVIDPDIPSAGTWTLAVSVRLDEFTAVTASTSFPVR